MQCNSMKVVFEREYPHLGQKIKDLRQVSPKSLTRLAADAGISTPHWNRIENEKVRVLPLKTLKSIEKALGADLGVSFD